MDEVTKNLPWDSLNSYVEAMAIERWADATTAWIGIGFMSFVMLLIIAAIILGIIMGFSSLVHSEDKE